MGTNWDYYRQRRALDVCGWSDHLKIKTYEDMCKYLLGIGVIPPSRDHDDVVRILDMHQSKDLKGAPADSVSKTLKPKGKTKSRSTRKKSTSKSRKM